MDTIPASKCQNVLSRLDSGPRMLKCLSGHPTFKCPKCCRGRHLGYPNLKMLQGAPLCLPDAKWRPSKASIDWFGHTSWNRNRCGQNILPTGTIWVHVGPKVFLAIIKPVKSVQEKKLFLISTFFDRVACKTVHLPQNLPQNMVLLPQKVVCLSLACHNFG